MLNRTKRCIFEWARGHMWHAMPDSMFMLTVKHDHVTHFRFRSSQITWQHHVTQLSSRHMITWVSNRSKIISNLSFVLESQKSEFFIILAIFIHSIFICPRSSSKVYFFHRIQMNLHQIQHHQQVQIDNQRLCLRLHWKIRIYS